MRIPKALMTIMVLLALLLFCQGASLGVMMVESVSMSHLDDSLMGKTMWCCGADDNSVAVAHMDVVVPNLITALLLIAVAIAGRVGALYNAGLEQNRQYARNLACGAGTTAVFEKLKNWLRLGILHPQIW